MSDDTERKLHIMNEAHKTLLKVVEVMDGDAENDLTVEEKINASCYIGLGIITSNLMCCDNQKERSEMADILIGHCIETIQNSVNSLNAMMPERPSGIIRPN